MFIFRVKTQIMKNYQSKRCSTTNDSAAVLRGLVYLSRRFVWVCKLLFVVCRQGNVRRNVKLHRNSQKDKSTAGITAVATTFISMKQKQVKCVCVGVCACVCV